MKWILFAIVSLILIVVSFFAGYSLDKNNVTKEIINNQIENPLEDSGTSELEIDLLNEQILSLTLQLQKFEDELEEKKACDGKWIEGVSYLGESFTRCDPKTSDEGKVCDSSDECDGCCQTGEKAICFEGDSNLTGFCSYYKSFGCGETIKDGYYTVVAS